MLETLLIASLTLIIVLGLQSRLIPSRPDAGKPRTSRRRFRLR
ncbi:MULTISPECIES: hypothetical protein [unclassified Epibacterium]|nr:MULTISPECIES: hypothetical protein [unclassified Epibacterium]